MKKIVLSLSFIWLLAQLVSANNSEKSKFKVDTEQSKVHWKGTKPAGEHVGTVSISDGEVHFKNGELSGGKFTIDLRTIVNDDLESEQWNKKLVDHLKSEDFFYVDKYPTASYEISKVEKTGDHSYKITGFLTMKEVSKAVTFNAELKKNGEEISATSEPIILDRTKWKVEAMSKSIFADLKDNYVDDEMEVKVELVAK